MKKTFFLLLVWLSGFAFAAGAVAQDAQPKESAPPLVSLYFTEFDIKTHTPLTMEDIESRADYRFFFFKRNPFLDETRKMLEWRRTDKEIDQGSIRMRLNFPDELLGAVYFVDSNGVVFKNGTDTFLLEKEELEQLESKILNFSGVVDMRPAVEPWPETNPQQPDKKN